MFNRLIAWNVLLLNRYLPSPFVCCILLTAATLGVALLFTNHTPSSITEAWGNGMWSLLGFSMQMALVLISGHVLAKSPIVDNMLNRIACRIHSPKTAILVVTLAALAACWINWGFGLVVGAVLAKALARHIPQADYPLLVASAYSGFLIWHGGLSGSIPLSLASGGETLSQISGGVLTSAIPLSNTLFSHYNLLIVAGLMVGLPLLNMAMMPQKPNTVDPEKLAEPLPPLPPKQTWAQKADDSRLLAWMILLPAAAFFVWHFTNKGFALNLNIVISLFLFLGLLAHGTPERYSRTLTASIGGIAGIVLLFPFYSGIMGMINSHSANGESLGLLMTSFFMQYADTQSFPVWAFISAGLLNVFVPSGGGQWALQGPVMLPAAVELGVSPTVTAMAIAWGDAWTNMIQPFWALPLLGIAGLDARAIMGYCLTALAYSGILISIVFYWFV